MVRPSASPGNGGTHNARFQPCAGRFLSAFTISLILAAAERIAATLVSVV
jgi:hypothetical protein